MFVPMKNMQSLLGGDFGYMPTVPDSPPRQLATLDEHIAVTDRLYEAFVELTNSPSDGTGPNPIRDLVDRIRAEGDIDRYYLVLSSGSTVRSVVGFMHRNRLHRRLLRCAIAIHRHRLEHGDWPSSLDAFSDRSLTVDPYTGNSFGYAVDESGPKLWAAGPDRDDDGGRPMPDPAGRNVWLTLDEWADLDREVRAARDGDIVVFPPETEPDRDDL